MDIKSELDIIENSVFIIIVLALKVMQIAQLTAHAQGNRHFCNYANFRTIGHQTKKKNEIACQGSLNQFMLNCFENCVNIWS